MAVGRSAVPTFAGILLLAAGAAHGQESARPDPALTAGNLSEAGAAHRRAFDETRDPTHLKKAGEVYMRMGAEGRTQAIEVLTMFAQNARTIEEAREARALLEKARALPEPETPPPPPEPAVPAAPPPEAPPVVVTPAVPELPPALEPLTTPLPDPASVEVWDALYLQDGSVVRGLLVAHVPGQDYRVTLPGGNTVVLAAQSVREVRKEPNPGYRRYLLPDDVPAAKALARPGFRATVQGGVALPVGRFSDGEAFDPSFDVHGRLGWEFIWGHFGLWPAARVEYIRWSNAANTAYNFLHLGADVRLSGHVGRVVPYLVLGAGADLSYFDTGELGLGNGNLDVAAGKGFGFHVGPGLDVLLSRHAAVGFSVSYHPGFADLVTGSDAGDPPDVSYLGFTAGFSIYQ